MTSITMRVCPKSSRSCQTPEHELDHGEIDEGSGGSGEVFEITGEPAVSADPGEGAGEVAAIGDGVPGSRSATGSSAPSIRAGSAGRSAPVIWPTASAATSLSGTIPSFVGPRPPPFNTIKSRLLSEGSLDDPALGLEEEALGGIRLIFGFAPLLAGPVYRGLRDESLSYRSLWQR
jgi:hypothetical protein